MERISVVIPTLNEAQFVPNLLADLHQQTLLPAEVLVVDAHSPDNTAQIVKKTFPQVKVISTEPGVAHQRTLGLQKTSGEILFLLDADVRLKPDFIEKSVSEFKKRNLQIACPSYKVSSEQAFVTWIYIFFNVLFWSFQKIMPAGAGCCIIVTREAFKRSLGFDANQLTDDLDFIYRVGKKTKFGQLSTVAEVSDRRFQKYGAWHVLGQYLVISCLFVTGNLKKTKYIRYPFGEY